MFLASARALSLALLMLGLTPVPLIAQPIDEAVVGPAETNRVRVDERMIANAKRFMDGYAAALLQGDPAEIGAHYDPDGVYEVRPAQKRFTPHDALLARYRERWSKPAIFEWRELSYEVLAPDKVLVVGLFAWSGSRSAEPEIQSYVAVLRIRDGRFHVRLEAEAWQDGASWSTLAGVALLSCLTTLLIVWLSRVMLRRRAHRAAQSRSSAT